MVLVWLFAGPLNLHDNDESSKQFMQNFSHSKAQSEARICLIETAHLTLHTQVHSLSQASAGSEFICSRDCSKRVMNQTMSDVPDPLIVHVLLLTHEYV